MTRKKSKGNGKDAPGVELSAEQVTKRDNLRSRYFNLLKARQGVESERKKISESLRNLDEQLGKIWQKLERFEEPLPLLDHAGRTYAEAAAASEPAPAPTSAG